MLKSNEMQKVISMFNDKSTVAKEARVSVETPDGSLWDIQKISLVQNKIIGSRETHRIVIKICKEIAPPGKVIGKL